MNFNEIAKINNEIEQISKTYELLNEEARLNCSQAARIEFLTTIKYIELYLKPNHKILDIGAGAGEYSLYFAKAGYDVSAIELADKNIEVFSSKINKEQPVSLIQGNAMDLAIYNDKSFDIVMLFGPLYHLHNEEDRQKCIAEAKRVCKDDGVIFFAFIAHDMVLATELVYNQDFFKGDSYNHESLRLRDFPFVLFTVDECREMINAGNISIIKEVATDGLSELLADKINALDEEGYNQYLKYHFYCCEKPELLGHSNHLLFIGEKRK